LSTIEFIKLTSAKITVLDMNEKRLAFCKQTMGVDHVIRAKGDGAELEGIKAITDGALFPLVVDATGSNKSMSHALNYVAHTGKLVFVGITTDEVRFPHPLMHRREMTLLASRNALPADFDRIIGLIEAGTIDTRPWITHRTPFDEMIANFPSYTKPETGVIKAIVEVQ
jgi:alcohol dehydrogenase